MKFCKTCSTEKPLSEFSVHCSYKCKACVRDYNKEYAKKNAEKARERTIQWRMNNPEKTKLKDQRYYEQNRERELEKNRKRYLKNKERDKLRAKLWRENNKGRVAANLAAARATKRNATPKWADLKQIRELYIESQQLTESTGVSYQVDHIVPLKSKVVCGLHCSDNLRIITAEENNSKNNKLLEELL